MLCDKLWLCEKLCEFLCLANSEDTYKSAKVDPALLCKFTKYKVDFWQFLLYTWFNLNYARQENTTHLTLVLNLY